MGGSQRFCQGRQRQAWRPRWDKANQPQLCCGIHLRKKEIINLGLSIHADFIVLCFEEAVYDTWPIVQLRLDQAELAVAGSCRWGGRKGQPSLGVDSRGGVGSRLTASKDKGMQPCD